MSRFYKKKSRVTGSIHDFIFLSHTLTTLKVRKAPFLPSSKQIKI